MGFFYSLYSFLLDILVVERQILVSALFQKMKSSFISSNYLMILFGTRAVARHSSQETVLVNLHIFSTEECALKIVDYLISEKLYENVHLQ